MQMAMRMCCCCKASYHLQKQQASQRGSASHDFLSFSEGAPLPTAGMQHSAAISLTVLRGVRSWQQSPL